MPKLQEKAWRKNSRCWIGTIPRQAHSLQDLILYKARWSLCRHFKTWSSHEPEKPAQRAKTFCSLTNQRASRYSRVTNHGTDYPLFSWHFLFCLRFIRVLFRFEFRFSPPAKFYFNVRTFSSLYFRYRELVSHLFFFSQLQLVKKISLSNQTLPLCLARQIPRKWDRDRWFGLVQLPH